MPYQSGAGELGISGNVYAAVMWHSRKQTNIVEWSDVVHSGKLAKASAKSTHVVAMGYGLYYATTNHAFGLMFI